jgi:hypothetical protein
MPRHHRTEHTVSNGNCSLRPQIPFGRWSNNQAEKYVGVAIAKGGFAKPPFPLTYLINQSELDLPAGAQPHGWVVALRRDVDAH